MTASPTSGWWSTTTSATLRSGTFSPSRLRTATSASSSGVTIGWTVRDREPLVGRVDEAAGADHGAARELQQPGVERVGRALHDLVERDAVRPPCAPGRPGPGACASARPRSERWPRRARGAGAPGSSSRRSSTCRSATRVSDDSPIFMTRLVADSGGIITGGAAQVGSVGVTFPTRSATSCRACSRSVPRSKKSVIEDSCGTDFERIMSRPGSPWSACSSGTVTSSSTSAADSPRVIVWISTRGGANSGKTSTGASRSWSDAEGRSAPRHPRRRGSGT